MRPIQTRRAAVQLGRAGRLVLAATVGRQTLDARLAALAPIRQALGPASVALFDDGTLAGADRVRIARACGDPLILSAETRIGAFPAGPAWALLLAALEQRRNAYWVLIGDTLPEHAIPDLARAIASNRCFAIVNTGKAPEAITPHLEAMVRDGLPYANVSAGLLGFAASGDGLALPAAIFARLEAVLGKRVHRPDMACVLAGFILAREREPVLIRDISGAVHSPASISML